MQRREFLGAAMFVPPLILTYGQASSAISQSPFILNSGIGGNNTVDLLARIDKDCLFHAPDMTILMIGTNDMNSRKYIPLPEYEKNLKTIIEKIIGVKSRIMLMTILPVYEPYLYTRHPQTFYGDEGHVGRKKKVNETIKKLADEYKLEMLDMHHIFEKVGNIGEETFSLIQNMANAKKEDGVHPTPDGYRIMAVAIYQKLLSLNVPYQKLVCFGDSITFGGGKYTNSYPGFLKELLGYEGL